MIKFRQYCILAAIIAAGIIVAAVIFRGCEKSPSHKVDAKEVKSAQEQLKQVEQAKAVDSARQSQARDSLQLALNEQKNKTDVVGRELTKTQSKLQVLLTQHGTAKKENDTAAYIASCDSLAEVAHLQGELLPMYQAGYDSITQKYDEIVLYSDSLLRGRQDLIVQLRAANSLTAQKYAAISSDYNKVYRKLKRERTLGRILAGGAAVLGGLLILKK